MWEHEVVLLLEDNGRHDLVLGLDRRERAGTARGIWNGVWATRKRMDRKLALVSEFVPELDRQRATAASAALSRCWKLPGTYSSIATWVPLRQNVVSRPLGASAIVYRVSCVRGSVNYPAHVTYEYEPTH